MSNAVNAAERVLNELGITDPNDLRLLNLIALERHAVVVEEPLEGAEASLIVIGKRAIITISTHIENSQRKRFSIAHELGHLELHRGLGLMKLCESADINDWKPHQQVNRENEANEFAAAFLLPAQFFGSLCTDQDPSLDHISELAEQFDVSLTATAIRYSQFCEEPIAIVFSQESRIKWVRSNREFDDLELFIEVGKRLDPASQANRFFDGERLISRQKEVLASSWLAGHGYGRHDTIQEHSLAVPKYNAVLTLLWIDEELNAEDDAF